MDRIARCLLSTCGLVALLVLMPSLARAQSEQQGVGATVAESPQENKAAPPGKSASENQPAKDSVEQPTAPIQPSIEEVEAKVNNLKAKVSLLTDQSRTSSQELNRLRTTLGNAEQRLFFSGTAQKILHPTRLLSPLLANIGFICGGIVLLYIVLTRHKTARSILSMEYPFSLRIRRLASAVQPMGEGARWFWAILLILILLMLAVPAFSQEPAPAAQAGATTPDSAAKDSSAAAESSQGVGVQMDQAVKYIQMTPLERAIYVMEVAPENTGFKLVLDKDVLDLVLSAAAQRNHPPLIEMPTPPQPVNLDLKKGTPGYNIVLASLYEAANRPAACETLLKGIQPFTTDAATLKRSMPFKALNAVLMWLAACDAKDLAKLIIVPAAETAPDLQGMKEILGIAEKFNLTEEARKTIEVNIPRVKEVEEIEGLFDLAQQKGHTDLAQQLIEANVPKFNLETQLRLIRRFHKLGDAAKTENLLGIASGGANLAGIILIAETANELGLKTKAGEMLGLALQRSYDGPDVDKVLACAAKLDCLRQIMTKLQGSIASRESMADWAVAAGVPGEFGVTTLDKEQASLASVVGVNLYTSENAAALRPLFEQPVMHQLDVIVKSLGAQPQMRINDLYILARYYELANNPALEVTRRMVALQQQLRGLDKAGASAADARRLALMMEMEQLQSKVKELEKAISDAKAGIASTRGKLLEVRMKTAVLVLESLAKAVLVILGLWIALSRAIAAARDANNWLFSNFCWKFLETIGFECCCTVVAIPIGIPITLISQDRLKHLHLMEIRPEPVIDSSKPTLPTKKTDEAEDV